MCAHDAADHKVTEGHGQGSIYKQCSSTNLVDKEKHDRREDDEEGVLYTASNEINVARETRHGEDVHDVVCLLY